MKAISMGFSKKTAKVNAHTINMLTETNNPDIPCAGFSLGFRLKP